MTEITPFEAYRREWQRQDQPLFFEVMRAHPAVFRGRFPLIYDPSKWAQRTFWISDNEST